jgi:hypothetical protein
MSDEGWTIFAILGAATVIMARLDRLGKQLEAVCAQMKRCARKLCPASTWAFGLLHVALDAFEKHTAN